MAHYKYKAKITDDIDDAMNIIQMIGKSLNEGKSDKASALTNLSAAFKKLQSARYYIDRE